MLDGPARRVFAAPLNGVAASLERSGISPNMVTIAGFIFGAMAVVFVTGSLYFAGLIFFVLSRCCDAIDGVLARRVGETRLGGFFDATLSYIIYGGLAFAFVLTRQQYGLASSFFILGVLLIAVTDLATKQYRVPPAADGSLASSLILCGQTETFIFLALTLAAPWSFAFLPFLFGALCFVTAGARIAAAVSTLGDTTIKS